MQLALGIHSDTTATLRRPVCGRASDTVAHMEDL